MVDVKPIAQVLGLTMALTSYKTMLKVLDDTGGNEELANEYAKKLIGTFEEILKGEEK
jgi:hypothetical protein